MSYNYKSISNTPEERQRVIHPYCFWENAFTSDEIDKICSTMAETVLTDAAIAAVDKDENNLESIPGPVLDTDVRKSLVSFHTPSDATQWIFDRLNRIIEMINDRWYNVDINGYEKFQYTEYHDYNRGHYGWHCDMFLGTLPVDSYAETRKLSLTLLLNEPGVDFEGGELQFGHESNYESAKMKKGTIVIFPSFNLHRVAPVTKGVRKSIVVWTLGPKWK